MAIEIVDFSIKNGDFRYVKLPEGIEMVWTKKEITKTNP